MKIVSGDIYRVINKKTGDPEGVYQRGNYDQYDFSSVNSARSSNCHDIYQNKTKYGISKYRVTIELIEEDVDPPNEDEILKAGEDEKIEQKMNELGLEGFDRMSYRIRELLYNPPE